MDAPTQRALESVIQQLGGERFREIVMAVYNIGRINGGIAESEKTLAAMLATAKEPNK